MQEDNHTEISSRFVKVNTDEITTPEDEQKEADTQTWEFMGEQLNKEELKLLIKVSEAKTRHFMVGRFFLLMFYHFLFFCMTPFVALPVIFVLEGFDVHLIKNLRFFNLHMFFFI